MINVNKYKVWVLAPKVISADQNVNYYYDFTQSIEEYTLVFEELNIVWEWKDVTVENFKTIINFAIENSNDLKLIPIFFNLCDGDDSNNVPGVNVINYLNNIGAIFTGADEYFYKITTSKALMKTAFDKYKVSNASWKFIQTLDDIDHHIFDKIKAPLILKPSVSAGSMGVGTKNVVHNVEELRKIASQMFLGYRGWNLNVDGLIAESFIVGPEFTVFIIGNYDNPQMAQIFMPMERVFHSSLASTEKFLSFDRLWEIYEEETQMPNQENFYEYSLPNIDLIESIKQISWDAFVACKGKGYTRVDVRMDEQTKELFILEVNAQCGLSDDENYTSIGAIIKASNTTFTSVVEKIIQVAINKN